MRHPLPTSVVPNDVLCPDAAGVCYSVQVARSVSEVEAIRPLWKGWQWHPNSDIDFYLDVLRSRREFLRPHVMVAFRDGIPEAMLVGRLEERSLGLQIGYLNLPSPKAKSLTFIYGGLLGKLLAGGSAALVREILASLRDGEASMAYFNSVRADSLFYSSVVGATSFTGRDYFPTMQTHRVVSLPASVEAFHARLSSKQRNTQKRHAKKLLEHFSESVKVQCFCQASDLEVLFADAELVAKKTYQRGLGVGFVNSPEMRRRLLLQAEKGRLRAFVLYLAKQPVAFWIGTLYSETFHSDCMGYDPAFADFWPGMFLVMRVIERFCAPQENENVSAIDFGLGDAQYKQVLGTERWEDASFYMFAPTLRGLTLSLLRMPVALADRNIRRALGQGSVLQRIKTLWRRQIRPKQ